MSVRHPHSPFDVTQPPAGVRLQVGSTAALLRVPMTVMAQQAGVSDTVMRDVVLHNRWPVRTPREQITTAIESLLLAHEATDEQLATLWHAHVRQPRLRDASVDSYGRSADRPTPQPQPEDPDMLLPKQALSPQAARHFKLFRNPFDGKVQSDEQFFLGDDIRYVREAALQCARNSSFVGIVGESGAGKTTILEALEEHLDGRSKDCILIKPGVLGLEQSDRIGSLLKSADILHAIITTLDPQATVPQTLQARTVRVEKMLRASEATGNTHLLVIEEAHSLPDSTLTHLKRLHELRNGRRPLLGILLLAQPELKKRLVDGLRTGKLREVAQRCEVVDLLPLDGDLKAYLQCRARSAGAELGALMDDAAVDALRTRLTVRDKMRGTVSLCYPLAVNNWVTKCLNEAAALGVAVVSRDVVAAV